MRGDITIDLDRNLPSRWPADTQPYAPLLKLIRDKVRDDLGKAYAAGLIPGRLVEATIKATALDFLAGQHTEVEGRAYARAVQQLVVHLTPDEE